MLRLITPRTGLRHTSPSSFARRAASNIFEPPEQPRENSEPTDPNLSSSSSPSSSSSADSSTLSGEGVSGLLPSFGDPSGKFEDDTNISGVPATTRRTGNSGSSSTEVEAQLIPFNTHRFYVALEQSFDPPIARLLMKSTRGLLVERIGHTKHQALHAKDFDNGAYLFRAALSELRTELTMRTRKDTATLRTTLTALRKEVDILDAKMKEDVAGLKHEIQIDINNRKAESTADSKHAELAIEDMLHRTIVHVGDLRTDIEQAKWDNTRRGVGIIGAVVAIIILGMEFSPKRPPPPSPAPPPPPAPIIVERPLPSIRELESDSSSEFTEPMPTPKP